MNVPYVKKFNEVGEVTNPIIGVYNSRENFPQNRSERRKKVARFRGNKKGISLTVIRTSKYKRVVKIIESYIDGIFQRKTINHYV